jgi:hypothetical protein
MQNSLNSVRLPILKVGRFNVVERPGTKRPFCVEDSTARLGTVRFTSAYVATATARYLDRFVSGHVDLSVGG